MPLMMDRRAWVAVLAGAAGAAVAIGLMEAFAARSAMPLMAIPFGTSIVLVLGSPEVDAAQPRALIGGHLVATMVGLVIVKLAGP
jgi:CBS-domain-containing membrane protein